jgi:hypothetical protein
VIFIATVVFVVPVVPVEKRRVRVRWHEEIRAAIPQQRPVVDVTVWPEGSYAGTNAINESSTKTK